MQSVKDSYTFAVTTSPFRNDLQNGVKASFSPSGFVSLKQLNLSQRTSLRPPNPLDFETVNGKSNHASGSSGKYRRRTYKPKSDLFSNFEYGSCPYDSLREDAKREKELRSLTLTSFSRKPFSCTASKIRMKHEDIVENENYSLPLLGPSVPDEVTKNSKQERTSSQKYSFRLGCASSQVISASIAEGEQRRSLETWCHALFDRVSRDWPNAHFRMRVTNADEISFSFQNKRIDSDGSRGDNILDAAALKNYMTHLAVHGDAAKLNLSRRVDRWGTLEDANGAARKATEDNSKTDSHCCIVFSFLAPWVAPAGSLALRRVDSLRCRVKARQFEMHAKKVV